jgi:multidrug efflux pump subunit AcrA (membrane-fusion protein)
VSKEHPTRSEQTAHIRQPVHGAFCVRPHSKLALALISLVSLAVADGCVKRNSASAAAAVTQPLSVGVVASIGREVPIVLSETGSFVADESSDVAPAVAGRVIRTPVSAGAFVKTGDILCELDHKDAEFKLQQMKAQLAEATGAVSQAQERIGLNAGSFNPAMVPEVAAAKASYEASLAQSRLASADAKRYANLIATGDVSQSVYEQKKTQADTAAAQADQARQQYEAAINGAKLNFHALGSSEASLDAMRAQVSQAEKGLADTTIRAPFDGYVSARPIAVGEFVATSTKVATVVRTNVLKLQMQIPERSAAGLKVGMPVTARVAAYGERDFLGTTSAVNPAVNPDSRAFVLEARFSNDNGDLRPGMFATAHVVLPGTEQAVFVPQTAVLRDRTTDSNQVFVVSGGKASLRVVTLGDPQAGNARVLGGVRSGELVAVDKVSELYDGAPINPQASR